MDGPTAPPSGPQATAPERPARPFLKWAGGKRQLLPLLERFYPAEFGRYWEPFLGSGAVFFDRQAKNLIAGHPATLTDCNPDLIACYRSVRDEVGAVIAHLEELAAGHQRLGARHYYQVRDDRFNPARSALSALPHDEITYAPALAAMFIYLNRTGYNGLFRLNAGGSFNVPAGRYQNPRICHPLNLRRVAAALKTAALRCATFESVLDEAQPGDFLYFDPPYAPLSRTARFTAHTAGGFSANDQKRLQQVAIELARRGCFVVMSNSTAAEIDELYRTNKEAAAAGPRCHRVPARRTSNSDPVRRGAVEEYLITNVNGRSGLS